MQKVDFRYSDSDFVSYLLSIGYKHTSIEITKDKDRYKAFVHFFEDKKELIDHLECYKSGSAKIDVFKFSTNRRLVNKLIKHELAGYLSHSKH